MMIKTHIFTNLPKEFLLKQSPDFSDSIGNIKFTFGVDVPKDADVLIVHRECKQSIPITLPKSRTVFVAGEPQQVRKISTEFLNQFGIVSSTYKNNSSAVRRHENYCVIWFAGIDYSDFPDFKTYKGHDFFSQLQPENKEDGIVTVVTSIKKLTPLHHKREAFLKILKARLGDKVKIYGYNYNRLGDKAEALIPYKYHISLENTQADLAWTEKLSDPLLCWTYSFYSGTPSSTIDLPQGSYCPIDISKPEQAVDEIINQMNNNAWEKAIPAIADARVKILDYYNTMSLFVRLTEHAMLLEKSCQDEQINVIKAEWMFARPGKLSKKVKHFFAHLLLKKYPMYQIWHYQIKYSGKVKRITDPWKRFRVWYRGQYHRMTRNTLR